MRFPEYFHAGTARGLRRRLRRRRHISCCPPCHLTALLCRPFPGPFPGLAGLLGLQGAARAALDLVPSRILQSVSYGLDIRPPPSWVSWPCLLQAVHDKGRRGSLQDAARRLQGERQGVRRDLRNIRYCSGACSAEGALRSRRKSDLRFKADPGMCALAGAQKRALRAARRGRAAR